MMDSRWEDEINVYTTYGKQLGCFFLHITTIHKALVAAEAVIVTVELGEGLQCLISPRDSNVCRCRLCSMCMLYPGLLCAK